MLTLAQHRRRRLWTTQRLADEAGVSLSTVRGIEHGRVTAPRFGTIGKLAAALGVPPEEIAEFAPVVGVGDGAASPARRHEAPLPSIEVTLPPIVIPRKPET